MSNKALQAWSLLEDLSPEERREVLDRLREKQEKSSAPRWHRCRECGTPNAVWPKAEDR